MIVHVDCALACCIFSPNIHIFYVESNDAFHQIMFKKVAIVRPSHI